MSRDSLSGDDATVDRYASSASAFRGLPGDLIVVVAYTVLAGGLVWSAGDVPSALRFVIGIPLLLFVPGYSLLAALFPGRPSRNAGRVSSLSGMTRQFSSMRSIQQRGVRWGERVALSFGLSLFTIPLLALILDFAATLFGTGSLYRTGPIVVVLVTFSLAFTLVGFVRRLRLPRAQRFAVPVGYWVEDFIDGATRSSIDALLNLVLLLSVLVAAASMSYALAVPLDGEAYTNVNLVAQDDSGQLVSAAVPTNFTAGEEQSLTISIDNYEQEPTNYTVVVQQQQVNDAGEVLSREELDRFSTPSIPENRTWQNPHSVAPTVAEDNLQLTYLVYQGDAPENPTEENAYRTTHLSINVSGGGDGGGGGGG